MLNAILTLKEQIALLEVSAAHLATDAETFRKQSDAAHVASASALTKLGQLRAAIEVLKAHKC